MTAAFRCVTATRAVLLKPLTLDGVVLESVSGVGEITGFNKSMLQSPRRVGLRWITSRGPGGGFGEACRGCRSLSWGCLRARYCGAEAVANSASLLGAARMHAQASRQRPGRGSNEAIAARCLRCRCSGCLEDAVNGLGTLAPDAGGDWCCSRFSLHAWHHHHVGRGESESACDLRQVEQCPEGCSDHGGACCNGELNLGCR